MVDDKLYKNVYTALGLACQAVKKSGMNISSDNIEMLDWLYHDELVNYFLMKAEKINKDLEVNKNER